MLTTLLLVISPSILMIFYLCLKQLDRTLNKSSVASLQDNFNSSTVNTSINNQVKTYPNYNSSYSSSNSYDNDDYNSTNYWQRLNEIQEENQMEREFYEDSYTSDPD